jgi:hypothetical protein
MTIESSPESAVSPAGSISLADPTPETPAQAFDRRAAEARAMVESSDFRDLFGDLPEVAPGVFADLVDRGGVLFINIVWSPVEGQGKVGRWLDSLAHRRVIVPAVISARFAGMLARRRFCYEPASDSWRYNPEIV